MTGEDLYNLWASKRKGPKEPEWATLKAKEQKAWRNFAASYSPQVLEAYKIKKEKLI